MTLASIKFRGAEHDVEFTDHGYEPDTNAHDIDWRFLEDSLNETDLSDADLQAIYDQLYEIAREREYYDGDGD